MKILLVHNSYQQRGGEDVVFEQERDLLRAKGHSVSVYCRSNRELENCSKPARVAAVASTVWAEKTRRRFTALLARERPDIVHVHNTLVMISPAVFWACHQAGIPVVQTLHNYRLLCPGANLYRHGRVCEECLTGTLWSSIRHGCYRESRTATAAVAAMVSAHRVLGTWREKVSAYIALSDFSRNKFISGGLPAEKIRLKPNFVHPDPGPTRQSGEYALFVGRLCAEKGIRTLMSAWKSLAGVVPLRIVGTGPLEAELRQFAAEAGNEVVLTGALPRAQVMAQIKSARFVICPSELYENFPMAIAEAYACGVPVLASRLGAMQDIVDDFHTGLLFAPGSAEDLAATASWAWSHPGRMSEMGKNARSEYVNKYTAAANYLRLMEIYGEFVPALARKAA